MKVLLALCLLAFSLPMTAAAGPDGSPLLALLAPQAHQVKAASDDQEPTVDPTMHPPQACVCSKGDKQTSASCKKGETCDCSGSKASCQKK